MSATTNSLVARVKRFAVPLGAVATLMLGVVFVFNHSVAHAAGGAGIVAAAPMDDSSVSSLVALDNAVESVAARVTPAVVNVSVTSRVKAGGGGEDNSEQGSEQGSANPFGALPPGFQRFFNQPGQRGQHILPPTQVEHGIGSGI